MSLLLHSVRFFWNCTKMKPTVSKSLWAFLFSIMIRTAPSQKLVDLWYADLAHKSVSDIQNEFISDLEELVSILKNDNDFFSKIDLIFMQQRFKDRLWVTEFIRHPEKFGDNNDIPKIEPKPEKTYRQDIIFLFAFNSLATDDDLREAFSETDADVKEAGIIQFVENKEQNKVCLWVALPNKKKFALVSQANITKLSFDVVRASEIALESFSHDEDVYKYFRPLSDHRLNAALEISRELGMGESKPMSDADFNRIFNNG